MTLSALDLGRRPFRSSGIRLVAALYARASSRLYLISRPLFKKIMIHSSFPQNWATNPILTADEGLGGKAFVDSHRAATISVFQRACARKSLGSTPKLPRTRPRRVSIHRREPLEGAAAIGGAQHSARKEAALAELCNQRQLCALNYKRTRREL
jgi:hypothetical protein